MLGLWLSTWVIYLWVKVKPKPGIINHIFLHVNIGRIFFQKMFLSLRTTHVFVVCRRVNLPKAHWHGLNAVSAWYYVYNTCAASGICSCIQQKFFLQLSRKHESTPRLFYCSLLFHWLTSHWHLTSYSSVWQVGRTRV